MREPHLSRTLKKLRRLLRTERPRGRLREGAMEEKKQNISGEESRRPPRRKKRGAPPGRGIFYCNDG
jgi:hypothetical protein